MKKIFLLLSVISVFTLSSCSNDEVYYEEYYFDAEVFELGPVNFAFDEFENKYAAYYELNPDIDLDDMLLVYRLNGVANEDGRDIWELIPRTIHLGPVDEIDYDFNFTYNDIMLLMDANFDLALAPEYTQNQIFRVVIIPGYETTAAARMDYSDYDAVIKQFNIDDTNIKKLEVRK